MRRIDKIDAAAGAGEGGVEPAVEIDLSEGVGHNAAQVDEHVLPLAALCLVAGDAISELHLQGIEIGVGFKLTETAASVALEGRHHTVEKPFGLLAGEGRCAAEEAVENDFHIKLKAVAVGEANGGIGESQAVEAFLLAPNA